MATGKAIIYKGIPYFSDVKVPTRVSQLANDAGYLTTHQDISGKADKSATVSTVTWSGNKLTKTINGTTSDVVSAATILGNLTSSQVTTALGYVPGPSYIFESSDNSINISDSMVPGRETIDLTVNGKVSTEGDTISGDYVNTADFSESGVYGKRVTTYGPWGIDVEEYVGTSLWSKLALRDSDILLTKTWDGTHDSLKSSITSLKQSFADYFTKSYTITASSERVFIKNLATQAYGYMNSKSLPFMLVNATWDGQNTGYIIISSTRHFLVQVGDSMSLGIINAAGTDIAQLRSVTTTTHS